MLCHITSLKAIQSMYNFLFGRNIWTFELPGWSKFYIIFFFHFGKNLFSNKFQYIPKLSCLNFYTKRYKFTPFVLKLQSEFPHKGEGHDLGDSGLRPSLLEEVLAQKKLVCGIILNFYIAKRRITAGVNCSIMNMGL